MSTKDCPFCDIVRRGEPAARIVNEDQYSVAFMPLNPAARGHVLVVPREHIKDLWELDDELAGRLVRSVLRVARGVRKALNPDGLNVINSAGEAASQTIWHLHMHVVPRWHHDAMGRIWPSGRKPDDDLDAVAQEMRDAFRNGG